MRGSNTLFADIFYERPSSSIDAKKKGRSASLHARRNECLVHRYYYYGSQPHRPSFESIVAILSDEFFINPSTIVILLSKNYMLLREVKTNPPSIPDLKEKWPQFVWHYPSPS